MIDGGLAVIAACLPTLRCLFGKVSFANIVKSVRSALSLDSTHKEQSQESVTLQTGHYIKVRTDSATSQASMIGENRLEKGMTKVISGRTCNEIV